MHTRVFQHQRVRTWIGMQWPVYLCHVTPRSPERSPAHLSGTLPSLCPTLTRAWLTRHGECGSPTRGLLNGPRWGGVSPLKNPPYIPVTLVTRTLTTLANTGLCYVPLGMWRTSHQHPVPNSAKDGLSTK